MSYGMCARCVHKMECRFRQQGTWVVECEYFRESPKGKRSARQVERPQREEPQRRREPA